MKPTELKDSLKFNLKEESLHLSLLLIKNPSKPEKLPLELGFKVSYPTLTLHIKEIKIIMLT